MRENLPDTGPLTVALLLFRAGGLEYGVPAFQIRHSGKAFLHKERVLPGLPWIVPQEEEERVGLFLHTAGDKEYLVPISSMEEVLDVPIFDIRPFPDWLAPRAWLRRMWGLLARQGRFYILLDFGSILGQNTGMDAKTDDPKEAHTQESP